MDIMRAILLSIKFFVGDANQRRHDKMNTVPRKRHNQKVNFLPSGYLGCGRCDGGLHFGYEFNLLI